MSKEALKRAFIAGCLSHAADKQGRERKFEAWYENECAAIVDGLPAVEANRQAPTAYDPAKDYTNPAFAPMPKADRLIKIELNAEGRFVAYARGVPLPYEISEDSGLFTVRAPDGSRICTRLWREPAEAAIVRYRTLNNKQGNDE